jgi:hypothetical protein
MKYYAVYYTLKGDTMNRLVFIAGLRDRGDASRIRASLLADFYNQVHDAWVVEEST